MMILELKRVGQSEAGTFGVLLEGKVPFAVTLEEPWRNNAQQISCIPSRDYLCRRVQSPKFGETFQVLSVDRRSHILFHKGNSLADTQGCILIGEEYAVRDGIPIVASSAKGYQEFMQRLIGLDEFELSIQEG